MTWDKLFEVGGTAYNAAQQTKVATATAAVELQKSQNDAARLQLLADQQKAESAVWYKQKWVIPAAVGLVLVVVFAVFRRR